jgi:hypothetical protein
MLGLATIVKLPGWIAIATGLMQLAITVGGTTLGTFGSYGTAQTAYNAAREDLLQQRKTLLSAEQQLGLDRQRLHRDMTRLAGEMTQLIRKCDLKVTLPASPPIDPGQQVQPSQPLPQVQTSAKDCWEQYQTKHAQYVEFQKQWNEINERTSETAIKLRDLADQMRQLPWPSSRTPGACLESLSHWSLVSAGTPLVVGYVIWALGVPLICFGCFWLALVRRIFLAPPHCYLEPF